VVGITARLARVVDMVRLDGVMDIRVSLARVVDIVKLGGVVVVVVMLLGVNVNKGIIGGQMG
jgi:hypothetical protein